jgi:uncharacterized protein YukE
MADNKIEVLISARSDDKGLQEFIKGMDKVTIQIKETNAATQESTSAFGKLGGVISGVAGAFAALGVISKVTGWLKEGVLGAIEEERALSSVMNMVKQFDPTVKNLSSTLNQYIDTMGKVGMEDGLVLESIRRLMPITQDYSNAVKATTLAWDLATWSGKNYQESLDLVAGLVANSPRSLKQANKDLGLAAKDCQAALDAMYSKFGGYSREIDDHTTALNRMKNAWKNFWEDAASVVMSGFDAVMPNLKEKMDLVAEEMNMIGEKLKNPGDILGGEGGKAWQYYTDRLAKLREEYTKLQAQLPKAKDVKDKTKDEKEGAPSVSPYGLADKEARSASGDNGYTAAFTAELAARAKAEQEFISGLFKEIEDDKVEKQKKAYAIMKAETEDYFRHLGQTSALFQQDISRMNAKELRDYLKKLRDEEKFFKEHNLRMEKMSGHIAEVDMTLDKQSKKEKAAAMLQYAQVAAQIAETAFGKNKALAIVGTIINTAAAAVAALNPAQGGTPLPAGAVPFALTLAMGAAQLASIMSTKASAMRGFDIPPGINPLTQLHEQEMVLPREQADVIRALASKPSTSISNRYGDSSQVIQVNALTGAYGIRQASKKLKQGDRLYKAMRVR